MAAVQSKLQIHTPVALTIAGSDSGGGAGIQADLKAFSALGVYGASVITAVTAQNTRAVTAVHDIPESIVVAQIRAVIDDLEIAAIKIGMLSSSEIIEAVSSSLEACRIPLVLDPVMIAKSGDCLLKQSAIDELKSSLLPRATLITPNLPEAATLLQSSMAANESEMESQGKALLELGAQAVLMKGGHARMDDCVDLLLTQDSQVIRFCAARVDTQNTHGTGCTLSAAIAAHLALGESLAEAVASAHAYLNRAIRSADQLRIGSGCGPVHHFHRLWST